MIVPSTYLQNLQETQANLAQTLADETAYQAINGAKPTYTIDGKNVQWTEYRAGMIQALKDIQLLIQQAQSPFWVVSRGRS